MSNLFKLNDVVQLDPQKSLVDLSKTDKHRLMDSVLQSDVASGKRGLEITFNLSSSGRRINNRIYTPSGQRGNVDSWTHPYPKAIIRNHDESSDALGRFTSVEWHSLDAQASTFFKNVQTYADFKDALESDVPHKIYRALHRRNFLMDSRWPGIGQLIAKARIFDEDAIEKFLDGRYLTFSAGTHTDRYVCGVCNDDWAAGEICDHRPGQITDEGKPVVFITGAFIGDEGSVLNMPANDMSMVLSMEMTDAMQGAGIAVPDIRTDGSGISLTDALFNPGETMSGNTPTAAERLMDMDVRDVARQFVDGKLAVELQDALKARTHLETSWLIRIHDALHAEYDWRFRYQEDGDLEIPTDTFKLHGDLHMLSQEKDFRGSLVNGALDGFDSAGKKSTEYMVKGKDKKEPKGPESQILDKQVDTDALVETIKTQVLEALKASAQDGKNDNGASGVQTQKEKEEEGAEALTDAKFDELDLVDSEDVDWYLLDTALRAELGEAILADEAVAALKPGIFCGPDRRFPVCDQAHFDAAAKVLEQVKLSDESKDALRACIDRKATILGIEIPERKQVGEDVNDEIQKDYAVALKTIEELTAEIAELKNQAQQLDNTQGSIQNQDTSNDPNKGLKPEDIKPVENPGGSGTPALKPDKELDSFQQNVVNKYKTIRDEQGENFAAAYLYGKVRAGYLPRTFDINKYL